MRHNCELIVQFTLQHNTPIKIIVVAKFIQAFGRVIHKGITQGMYLNHRDRGLKSCQLIAFVKFVLLRNIHFSLKSGLQVIAFVILLEVGYLVSKLCFQMSRRIIFGILQNNV